MLAQYYALYKLVDEIDPMKVKEDWKEQEINFIAQYNTNKWPWNARQSLFFQVHQIAFEDESETFKNIFWLRNQTLCLIDWHWNNFWSESLYLMIYLIKMFAVT